MVRQAPVAQRLGREPDLANIRADRRVTHEAILSEGEGLSPEKNDPRAFEGEVDVRLLATSTRGRRNVRFLAPVTYRDMARGLEVTIPAGAETDWTSAPRWAWWLIPAFDKAAEASALHDHLLTLRGVIQNGLQVEVTRAEVDRLYREALRPLGISQWRRNLHWVAVRFQAWVTGDR